MSGLATIGFPISIHAKTLSRTKNVSNYNGFSARNRENGGTLRKQFSQLRI